MLIQCLKETVLTLSAAPPPTSPQEVDGERGGAPEAVVVFSSRVGELKNCLMQMTQHMGMLVLQQKRAFLVSVVKRCSCAMIYTVRKGNVVLRLPKVIPLREIAKLAINLQCCVLRE